MGMADPRSHQQMESDFHSHKNTIIGMVEELIAVNSLEYHNKNWLAGDSKTRCERISECLSDIKCELHNLKR